MATDVTTTTAVTPQSLLADWANDQDHWIRALVSEVIANQQQLTEERIQHYYELLLSEKQLSDVDPTTVPPLQPTATIPETKEHLSLSSLDNIQNVNKLASGQHIQFNPSLTVFFGENGTGKSGYVRILKRLASVRTAETVLPNIHLRNSSLTPKATITYNTGTTQHTVDWNNESGLHPFTLIDAFDARSTQLHLDQDLDYVYTPRELSLFEYVHDAVQDVKAKLHAAILMAKPDGNPFRPKFDKNSSVYTLIDTLGASTDLDQLRELAQVTSDEEKSLQTLRDKVNALNSNTPQTRLQLAKADKALYEQANRVFSTIADFNRPTYQTALTNLLAANARYDEATKTAFSDIQAKGVLTDAWNAFIQAGENYLVQTEQPDYPLADSSCIYCQQPLTAAALDLVKKYRDFSNNELKRALDDAKRKLIEHARPLQALRIGQLQTELETRLAAIDDHDSEQAKLLKHCIILAGKAVLFVDSATNNKPLPPEDPKQELGQANGSLAKELTDLDSLLDALQTEVQEREEALAKLSVQLHDLEARLILKDLLPSLRTHVQNAKWVDRADGVLTRFKPLLKSLTNSSKLASEDVLNSNFELLFIEECKRLRAPDVNLEFPGRQGKPIRRKLLDNDHKLSEILSEGEQKVIALADFIAEALMRQKATPVIFDDPVTSLDYRRLHEVVDRIVKISSTRQVIVFTHNIWFTMELLSRFEKNAEDCFYYDVSDGTNEVGIVSRARHPRADTFKQLKGDINRLIQDAGTATGPTQNALIERIYEYIRDICEVIVESDLLKGVTQRYQPNVMMTKLPQIQGERLQAAINKILPVYDKACRYIRSHSQPLETLSVRPSLDELMEDWNSILDARKSYLQ
ncbi:MAG: hypothetical protein DWQ31_06635 [Planctomycetota bacterium]|nr:MAG: hypothetical protein DWQ31_06635 [Planctomycetota bacterium]REJ90348.1 MAG: hypothetical protein DWQ35_16870 [Planctomycetota bacterium]